METSQVFPGQIILLQRIWYSIYQFTGYMFPSLPGVSVSVDVRYSRVMERQYLNVMFTPTLPFKGRTEGLCGLMDDETSNDLLGPRGEFYTDPVQFGKSCKKLLQSCYNMI